MGIMGERNQDYNLFKESLTGEGFFLKKVFTTKDVLRKKLKCTQRRTLASFHTPDTLGLKRLRSSARMESSEKETPQHSPQFKESPPSCDPSHTSILHRSGCAMNESQKQIVMFVIPYQILLRSDSNDPSFIPYSVLNVTDLKNNFSVLVVHTLTASQCCIGELWAVFNPQRTLPESLFPLNQAKSEAIHTARLVLTTENIVRIGALSGFHLCTYVPQNGRQCGIPFYDWEQHSENRKSAKGKYCSRHQSLDKYTYAQTKRTMNRLMSFHENARKNDPDTNSQPNLSLDFPVPSSPKEKKQRLDNVCTQKSDETNVRVGDLTFTTALSALTAFTEHLLDEIENLAGGNPVEGNEEKCSSSTPSALNKMNDVHPYDQKMGKTKFQLRLVHFTQRLESFSRLKSEALEKETKQMLKCLIEFVKKIRWQLSSYQLTEHIKESLDRFVFLMKRRVHLG